ncbi:MAG: hypothetical protein IJ347_01535 [Faecalibacterium sp.]|nr:hypothetical protein [Faecalibacterium sp.]
MKKVLKFALRALLLLLAALVLTVAVGFGYLYTHGMSGIAHTSAPAAGQIRVACVGDSTTYGHGITGWPKNNYPSQLQNLLGEGWHVNNYGVSSFAVQSTSDRPYATLQHYADSLAYKADYVVFMMGCNDSKPENWVSTEAFRAELCTLLDSYAGSQIVLCTPAAAFFLEGQTEGTTNHDIQPLIVEQIAQVCREVAAERAYTLVDIHTLTADHAEWFAKDGVHPDNTGAAAMAQAVCDVLSGLQ